MGELALITDYWNEAKFKQKHPVANLPASHHGIVTLVFNDSYTKYNSWYIGVIIVSKNLYIIITPKYKKKTEKNATKEKKKCYEWGDRTRDPWVGSPATHPLNLRKCDRNWLHKTLVRNDNSLIPLGVKAVV